ncbi:hypothetical protein EIP91_005263 [Steccherinum ochraceum]|uniref:Carbohydrate-binding module family 19 domain-containing protein n=1 Tax=Steccherinum ochraceum TaxID=92696 RepID=A0A4R0RRW9_9APHY|nr:hypothetical protein EIP91_005263 [Steccherinum ochraceum]
MVSIKVPSATLLFAVSALVSTVQAAPMHILQKRIAQVISDSTQQWVQACTAAGGGQQCNPISVTAFTTLLAAAGPCDQQNSADAMVDLAKQLNNDANMIKFAQIFAQQPRNSPSSQAVPYCQQAPKNAELNGLFQCQFQSADEKTFVGGATVGSAGTIPFGMNAPLSPPGSCPANPNGPITDGAQLVTITQNPGVPSSGGAAGGNGTTTGSGTTTGNGSTGGDDGDDGSAPADNGSDNQNGDGSSAMNSGSSAPAASMMSTPAATATAPAASAPAATATMSASSGNSSGSPTSSSNGSGSGFKLQNGEDAQALNAKFATLTADSSCSAGDNACVNGGFAQCVGGKFVITQCAGGTVCMALPLVNSPGTSITCTTQADAQARIAATGAQGGVTGN